MRLTGLSFRRYEVGPAWIGNARIPRSIRHGILCQHSSINPSQTHDHKRPPMPRFHPLHVFSSIGNPGNKLSPNLLDGKRACLSSQARRFLSPTLGTHSTALIHPHLDGSYHATPGSPRLKGWRGSGAVIGCRRRPLSNAVEVATYLLRDADGSCPLGVGMYLALGWLMAGGSRVQPRSTVVRVSQRRWLRTRACHRGSCFSDGSCYQRSRLNRHGIGFCLWCGFLDLGQRGV
jgi:hypothetical protein